MTNAATAASPATLAEEERKPIAPPEAHLVPPEASPPAESASIIVLESVRAQAEKNLAAYLPSHLAEALKARKETPEAITHLFENSEISLTSALKDGRTDVKIGISGPNITTSEALVGEVLVEVLKQHPLYAPLFAAEKPPHAQVAAHGGIELHIPQLETAAYAQLMQAAAADDMSKHTPAPEPQAIAAAPAAAAHADGCACETCGPSKDAATDNAAPEATLTEVAQHSRASPEKVRG